MLATAPNSWTSRPAVCRRRAAMFAIGVAGETVAVTSNPPENVSKFFAAGTNDCEVVASTTSVKTTSVNIARVTPVRNRLRSGYAIAMRKTGDDVRTREARAGALYMIVQVDAITFTR